VKTTPQSAAWIFKQQATIGMVTAHHAASIVDLRHAFLQPLLVLGDQKQLNACICSLFLFDLDPQRPLYISEKNGRLFVVVVVG
jgi:hypothetical protein